MAIEEHSYISATPSVTETTHVNPSTNESTLTRTYHWQTHDDRSIFLYLTFTLKQRNDGSSYFLVTTNVDSSSVRGQGVHLAEFTRKELTRLASEGVSPGVPPVPLLIEASPNQYSSHLVENDKSFVKKGENYYAVINP